MPAARAANVEAVRQFNRFYTRQIGVLQEHLLESPFSLAEGRVIYELGSRVETTASALIQELGLDAGYVSRMLAGFQRRGLVEKRRSESDGRQMLLRLSGKGRNAFSRLDHASHREIGTMLGDLLPGNERRLVEAMRTIERCLDPLLERKGPYDLRPHRPGDMGWVVHRHGVLYSKEYGWDEEFEALVAEIVAKFIRRFDPARDRCWIAEKDGENVGCIFCVERSKTQAQLRLLLVEPSARGMGLGARLVDECIAFARAVGYRTMILWTNDVLHAARRIYEAAGFHLVREGHHHSFGGDLVEQTWKLRL
ncbi:MAG: bifunctional helix-turn-helix transcriptional regulator/GNAT family N-acetyltransferase [Longimicrobiales bacterium]